MQKTYEFTGNGWNVKIELEDGGGFLTGDYGTGNPSEAKGIALDGMESLLLGLAVEGADLTHPAFQAAVGTAIESIQDYYREIA